MSFDIYELHGCCGFNSELWISIFNEVLWFWIPAMNFEHQNLWIQNIASMEVEHWQRLQQVSIVESFIQVSTTMEFQQWGVLTIVTTSTMKSFNNNPNYNKGGASRKVFILNELSFLSLPTKWSSFPNHGKVRIFFPHFKLWPNFMGSIPIVLLVFFMLWCKLCELITSTIALVLIQSLKLDFHPRVPNSSTPCFQNSSSFSSHQLLMMLAIF